MRTPLYSLSLIGLMCLALFAWFRSTSADTALSGWARSKTVGWVSLNCADTDSCTESNYAVSVGEEGVLSGYAWSEHIGWVSAEEGDVAGCPEAPCTPRLSGGYFSGWMKALAAEGAESGGWDGWIRLSGAGYGVREAGGAVIGQAWGDAVVGWLDFSATHPCAETQGYFCEGESQKYRDNQCGVTTIVETCPYSCAQDAGVCIPPPAPSGHLLATPRIVVTSGATRLSWSIEDADSCEVVGTNGDRWEGVSGAATTSPISGSATFTLTCAGGGGDFSESVTVVSVVQWREL